MDIKTKNILARVFALLMLTVTVSGCAKDNTGTAKTDSNANDKQNPEQTLNETVADKTISIDGNRCTGCGKCARIDSEHFAMNSDSRQAVVVSSKNTNTQNLDTAIAMCHERAISLN